MTFEDSANDPGTSATTRAGGEHPPGPGRRRAAVLGTVLLALPLSGCGAALQVSQHQMTSPQIHPLPAPGRIAFQGFDLGSEDGPEIFVINPDGTGRTRLTDSGRSASSCAPVFSPDGTRIAFYREDFAPSTDSTVDLYVMNADGSGQTRLGQASGEPCDDVADDGGLAFSPDGKQILLSMRADGDRVENVYVLDSEGGDRRRLTDIGGIDPVFSPDGSQIAFVNNAMLDADMAGAGGPDGPAPILAPLGVYVMNADGSDRRRLTDDGQDPVFLPGDEGVVFSRSGELVLVDFDRYEEKHLGAGEHPALHPDGTKLAFLRQVDGAEEVFSMSLDGTSVTRLTQDWGSDQVLAEPVFAPDGSRIVFNAEGLSLDVMDADGTRRAHLTDGFHPHWGSAAGTHATAAAATTVAPDAPAPVDLADGMHLAYLHEVDVPGRSLTFDVVRWIEGDHVDTPNRFAVLNDNPRLRRAPVTPRATVRWISLGTWGVRTDQGSLAGLPAHLTASFGWPGGPDSPGVPYELTVTSGRITDIGERYVP